MKERIVRRSDMVPCKSAFIDTYTPGSHLKDNFSIIGPGVTENPEQVVNIREPHGFNIGAAGQPPRIKNSLHSHFTAEVFMVHEGTFEFYWGLHAENHTILTEGDVVSIPTHCFRGFENIGDKYGFMFAILGGDDTGGVEWTPQVFEAAEEHGLVLLEDYGVWDTLKQPVPEGSRRIRPMSPDEAESYDKYSPEEMEQRICRDDSLKPIEDHPLKPQEFGSIEFHRLIGTRESMIPGEDGFELLLHKAAPGSGYNSFSRPEKEVLVSHRGSWQISWSDNEKKGCFTLEAGDLVSIPNDIERKIELVGSQNGSLFSVINSDDPQPPLFDAQNGHR
jgi:quercetin dioxygenase-like cupin family protein